MDKDGKFWFATVGCGFLCIVVIVVISSWHSYQSDKLYITNGYEQVMLPGSLNHKWQKVNRCGEQLKTCEGFGKTGTSM